MKHWEDLFQKIIEFETDGSPNEEDLERYLRALLPICEVHKNKQPSMALFAEVLREAFEGEPTPPDPAWVKIESPPIMDLDISNIEDVANLELTEKAPDSPEQDFHFFKQVVEFQISDIRRMKIQGVDMREQIFGVESPTGHNWYNFHPHVNLLQGIKGYLEQFPPDPERPPVVRWKDLGDILEVGRIYE